MNKENNLGPGAVFEMGVKTPHLHSILWVRVI